ncbi:MAG: hypothetical protein ACLFP6_03005 [Spirochaetaceae bacterium]
MKRTSLLAIAAFFALMTMLVACQTTPPEVPEDLSQAEFFQRAQDAADENRWTVALHYYETFIERYPEDEQNVIAAEYEIAFIHYKMEEYETSKTLFEDILATYEADEDETLPQWPRILSEKLLDTVNARIEEQQLGFFERAARADETP